MRLVEDSGVGAWVGPGLDASRTVRSLVPAGFEEYAVIFHPAFREVSDGEQPSLFAPWDLRGPGEPAYHRAVSWEQVAAANGRQAHPTMERAAITGLWDYRYGNDSQPGVWDLAPQKGSLPLLATVALCRALAAFTTTPAECFFGVSFIYGDLPDYLMRGVQVLDTYLVTGPLNALPNTSFEPEAVFEHYRAPNLWWPADRAWLLHSNYDLQETYIGASADCLAALVNDPLLEASRVDPDQVLIDEINPEPEGPYHG